VEADLEENVLRYKLGVGGKLHLEWSWQAEPGRGGMECTIFAHIRTGSSAISVQNKKHLHWKEIGTNSIMNDDTGGAIATHNLLLKRDHQCTEHLAHKQKMASILASPAGDTVQLGPVPDPEHGGVEEVGPLPPTPATHPSWMPTEGTPSIISESNQSFCKGSIGQVAALELGTHV
jgi:hypothetical protein